MTQSTKPMSPLRQRMLEDMALRRFAPKTQQAYIRHVANFTRFLGRPPDTADAEDLQRYQLHLNDRGASSITLNATITGLKFFFAVTLDRPDALGAQNGRTRAERLFREGSSVTLEFQENVAGRRAYQLLVSNAPPAGHRYRRQIRMNRNVTAIDLAVAREWRRSRKPMGSPSMVGRSGSSSPSVWRTSKT